jgi:hypothetical protein
MLNILGYEIDTTNTPWATAVMAKSSSIGLLKNVSTAAGSACPRQEAAQIIYNALTLPILQANALGVLVPSSDTILSKYLGGSSDVVVITGNEYADLNGTTPLEEGKTQVDGSTTLNWSTTLDMIGSSYKVWTVGNTVVYYEDAGNTVWETNEATSPAGITAKQVGLKLDGAEQYVNYSDDFADVYSTDIRIAYKYDSTGDGILDVDKVIKAGEDLTDTEVAQIKSIFKNASYETVGYVAVGTTDATASNDVSNTQSWKAFVKNYLNVTTGNTINAKVNENGNTIKVIDNNGDGVADYILKTEYVMDQIVAISGNGTYTLTATELNAKKEEVNVTVAADAMVSEDELSKEDVIVYALIDGVYYANIADEADATVASIDYKAVTITCGDETYQQSGIVNDTEMRDELIRMAKGQSYTLYFDNYGYVRAFIETNYGDYVLLTEMYRDTTDRNNLIKDANYTVEGVTTDGEVANYSVTSVGSAMAFYTKGATANGVKPATQMATLGTNETATAWTNVADCQTSGSSIDLTTAAITYNYKNGKTIETNYYALTSALNNDEDGTGIAKGQRRFYFTTDEAGEVTDYVNITSSTVIYTVTGTGTADKLEKVDVTTGYASIAAYEAEDINAVYAVATTTYQDSKEVKYPVADVLVIEVKSNTSRDFVFGFQKYTNVVESILSDGTIGTAVATADYTGVNFYDTKNGAINDDDKVWPAYVTTANIYEINKLESYIDVFAYKADTNANDPYVLETDVKKVTTLDYDTSLPVYTITANSKGILSATNVGVSALKEKQDLIIVWANTRQTEVSYIILVNKSDVAVQEVFDILTNKGVERTLTVDAPESVTVEIENEDDEAAALDANGQYTTDKGAEITLTFTASENVKSYTVKVNGEKAEPDEEEGDEYTITLNTNTTVEVEAVEYTYTVVLEKDSESARYINTFPGTTTFTGLKVGDRISFNAEAFAGYELTFDDITEGEVTQTNDGAYVYEVVAADAAAAVGNADPVITITIGAEEISAS